ncbi:hypothetical protein N0V90_001265 [Kalmusia sp. IMI 367209]|nr:hypothetical protein N0V90_001265 [Kalmusia sp. IMI 367209]
MSVEGNLHGNLQRSSWKAEAIRRGDLKISGPIPITEDVPLNEDEEKKFAEKHGTLSSSLPQDAQVDPMQHPPEPPHAPPPAPPVIQVEPHQQTSVQPEEHPQIRDEPRQSPPKQLAVRMQTTPERHRRSATEPISIASPSPLPSYPETPTRLSSRKKRKSGLRNVFRKMFGRRSRDGSEEDEVQTPQRAQTQRQSQRVSDIGMTRASSERKPPIRRGRISDLDVEEPAPINPLGQHLPFPMNVNAPQEISPPHEYLTFEAPTPDFSRRRATLPNVHTVSETQSLNGRDKRLETWEERHDGESIPSPQIGIALSSPPHARQSAHSVQSKRKSRSAGNLRELVKGRPSVERRRSAEIRYWRSSYASGSVYSTNTPRPRTAQTVETVRSAEPQDAAPALEEVVTKSVPTYAPTVVAQHEPDVSQTQLPVEAFNFGNLKSDFSDDEGSEEPAAVPARSERRISIEDRVKHLEENMRTLDASVRRLSGRNNRQTIILENAPKGRRSRNRSSSASSQRQGSHHSSKGSNNTLQFRQYEDEQPAPESPKVQPLSAVTEFPVSNDFHTQDPTTDLQAQLVTLQSSLQHERHARKLLEAQVSTLQRDLADLHARVHKFISAASPSYPTPSPDAIIASNEATTPRANEGVGSSTASSSREDVASPEAWATPLEKHGGFGSGFF